MGWPGLPGAALWPRVAYAALTPARQGRAKAPAAARVVRGRRRAVFEEKVGRAVEIPLVRVQVV